LLNDLEARTKETDRGMIEASLEKVGDKIADLWGTIAGTIAQTFTGEASPATGIGVSVAPALLAVATDIGMSLNARIEPALTPLSVHQDNQAMVEMAHALAEKGVGLSAAILTWYLAAKVIHTLRNP
jgi:hypothetical protein